MFETLLHSFKDFCGRLPWQAVMEELQGSMCVSSSTLGVGEARVGMGKGALVPRLRPGWWLGSSPINDWVYISIPNMLLEFVTSLSRPHRLPSKLVPLRRPEPSWAKEACSLRVRVPVLGGF